jgi:hypothetical protein
MVSRYVDDLTERLGGCTIIQIFVPEQLSRAVKIFELLLGIMEQNSSVSLAL